MKEFIWDDLTTGLFALEFQKNNKVGGVWQYKVMSECILDFKVSKQPQPEWEILNFKELYEGGYVYPVIDEKIGPFSNAMNISDWFISQAYYKIHSVKRLSDGEVFTVGDEFQVQHQPGDHWTIDRFEIGLEGDMRLISSDETGGYNWGLKIAIPYVLKMSVLLTPAQIRKLYQIINIH